MAGPEGDHDELQIDAGLLESLGVRLLTAAGMSELCARTVSQHVVGNSLLGVDSHGIVRFSQYLEFISAGSIDPAAGPLVVTDEDNGVGFKARELIAQHLECLIRAGELSLYHFG